MKSFAEVGISLNELLSKSSDLIQVIDTEGNLLYANEHWLHRLDYTPDSLESLNFIEHVLQSPFHSRFSTAVERLQSNQESQLIYLTLHSRDNQPISVEGHLLAHHADGVLQSIICIFHDLTERNHAQIEYERMFAMSVDMLGIADFEGNFVRLNPAWEQVLGYSLSELMDKPFISFVHPDDVERTIEESTRSTMNNKMNSFENRYICKDGTVKWISWHYISYSDMQQTYFVARDITQERSNQRLLQETKDQLQAILDNSGTIIGLKNLENRYILVNQEFADIFANGDKTALLDKKDADIFPSAAQTFALNDEKVQTSGRSSQFEETIITNKSTNIYLTTRFLVHDETGTPYGICMIAKDITYRKLTEMQLLTRNQAIEYSPSGISIADAQLPDMPLIYINSAFENTTGYSVLDVIGRNCRFLQNDDRDQEGVHRIREAIRAEQSVTVVIRNYRKNGELFHNELSLAPIHDEGGTLTHYVGISTDVSERIHNEAKIKNQNEELIEANEHLAHARKQAEDATRLKSQFLATMSHELRTPLNAIIGYTEIQLAGMTGTINDEQRDYQDRILKNADHLLALINDVLDISKIEAGRLELVHKPFDLREWIDNIKSQMEVLAADKSLHFGVEIDKRMPARLVGDPARIKQILINLISNAIKFTNEGKVRLAIRKHGRDAWKLVVEDTGIGIPSHLQEVIFEEFRQVDNTTRRQVGGTGLGLSIVKKLALMMGGNVRLTSQVGRGSTFTVILPLAEENKPVSRLNLGDEEA